jgi:hypothetical protein
MQNRIYLALESYEQMLQDRPDYAPAYIQLGLLCIKLGILGRGIDYLQKALRYRLMPQQRYQVEAALQQQVRRVHRGMR